jgi:hypothetical protein
VIGRVHHRCHSIETTGRPVFAKARHFDPDKLCMAKAEFCQLEAVGIIGHSDSPWFSHSLSFQKSYQGRAPGTPPSTGSCWQPLAWSVTFGSCWKGDVSHRPQATVHRPFPHHAPPPPVRPPTMTVVFHRRVYIRRHEHTRPRELGCGHPEPPTGIARGPCRTTTKSGPTQNFLHRCRRGLAGEGFGCP